jgi:ketosteroid isomerase-like protein
MNLSANKRLVARFLDLLNAGAHDEAVSLFAGDFIWSIPESIPGGGEKSAAEFRELLSGVTSLYDGQPQYTVVSMTAESDRVSAELIGVGNLKNGNHFRNYYHMLFFLSETSIRRVNEYVDTHYSIKSIFGG